MSNFSLNKGSVDVIMARLKSILEKPFTINGSIKCFSSRVLKCEENTFGILMVIKCANGQIMYWKEGDLFKFNEGQVIITEFKDGSVKRLTLSKYS